MIAFLAAHSLNLAAIYIGASILLLLFFWCASPRRDDERKGR